MNSLKKIKKNLTKQKIDFYLINKNNDYLNEFIEPDENRLRKISNFTGSMGFALIGQDGQSLYVDGRYTLQAKLQSKQFNIKNILHLKNDLKKIINDNKTVLINPKLFSVNFLKNFNTKNIKYFDDSTQNKTKPEQVVSLNLKYSGLEIKQKIKKLQNSISLKKNFVFLISSPENIAWLTNLRSLDKKFSYIFNCIAIYKQKKIYIFTDKKIKIKNNKYLIFKKTKDLKNILKDVKEIHFDQKTTSLYYFNLFKSLKIKTKFFDDPINYLKSIKNNNEISNLKIAHTFDGIAIVKFLYWLEKNKFKKISELDCQNKIENFKKKNKYYLGPSFETISAFGKNASIIHYNAKDYKTNYLRKNNLYLLDCGSQYFYGTTDMTRTVAIGKQSKYKKLYYTLVLKSHIKVSNFNLKKNTLGKQIDLLARKLLKLKKLDYNHGTGHGVGYLSNVHEHPPSISKYSNTKFYQNQVISNEPGYYKDNQFGIRLENLIFINRNRKFENLTLVPFDNTMIIKNMLSLKEKAWINKYHEDVFEKINKFLTMNERSYLRKLCLKIN